MSPEPPGDRGVGYLEEALELDKRLNRLRTTDGRRLCSLVVAEGFEPWWFLQEQVMWKLLVPYCRHRDAFHELLGGPIRRPEPPAAVAEVLSILAADLPMPPGVLPPGRPRRPRRILTSLSKAGLALVSACGLLLFRWRRRRTLLYILEQVSPGLRHDFRLDPIYRELRERGYRFGEYVHLQGQRKAYRGAWRNLLRRRRPVVFFEVLADLGRRLKRRQPVEVPEVDLPGDDPDSRFLTAVARWTVRQSDRLAQALPVLVALLRFQRVERAVVLDDSRHANLLVAACRQAGVPTLGYMHGLFNRYHTALMAFGFAEARHHTPDLYAVWSEYFRRRLFDGDLFDETGTAACGPLRAPAESDLAAHRPRIAGEPIRVLVVSEPRAEQAEVGSYLGRLVADPRFRVSLKVRPGEQRPHAAPALSGAELRVIRTGTVYEAFAGTDVVVGTYSSVLYEAAMAMLPAVVLSTSFTYGEDLAEDGLADLAQRPEEVCEVVARAAAHGREELQRRRRVLWEGPQGDGAANLFDLAEARLWQPPRRI